MANNIVESLRGLKSASKNVREKRVGSKPGRVDLVPQDFDNLIEDQGVKIRLTPVVLCPNKTDLTDNNHVLDCQLCSGDMVIEIQEQAVEEWAFIQAIKLNKDFQVQGIFDVKDALMTIKQGVRLYYWYKVEILDFSSIFNQLIKRGSGDTDNVRYNPTSGSDIPYHLIDSKNVRYEVDKHYKIEDRKIKWKTAKRPDSDTLYSVSYPVLPTFRVLEMLHENRYYYVGFKQKKKYPVQLPQQCVIRLDFFSKLGGGQNVEVAAT
jgi:hypothetical protein